jgi:DNA-binding SARP family transcriptional activator
MTLRLHLFGPLRCDVDGVPLRLPPRAKLISAWAYLLLHADHPVPRAVLAFTIWPDATERQARASLRRGLHRLQSLLPPPPANRPWLLFDGDLVRWNPEADVWIDVRAFDSLASDDGRLEQAVALVQGDLLQDLYDDWVLPERYRWRERLLTCLARLVDLHRRRGEFPQAINYADRLLSLEPLREDAVRRLMAVRYQSGDRAGALQVHARFVERLAAELGSQPMPETTALFETIQRHAPLPGEASPPRPAADQPASREAGRPEGAVRLTVPFVGRPAETAQLEALWSRAARGQGMIVLISGDSGIGKSRLAGELAYLAETQGGRVLLGSTTPGEPFPYQPFVAALRAGLPLLRTEELRPLTRSVLATLLPEVGAAPPERPDLPALDTARERARLFHALLETFSALARTRPMLLLLEDLHWAGAPTADLLEFLAGPLQRLPLLLVGTYRPEETPRDHPLRLLRRQLQRAGQSTQIALGPIDRGGVVEMFRLLGLTGAALDEAADRLHAESEGNPFFLLERLHDLEERGALRRAEGGWEFVAFPSTPPPASVQEAIASRLNRLSAPARAMLDTASVIGAAFDLELLAEVSGWSEPQAEAGVQELLDHQLVRELAPGRGFDFGFSHHLVQETAYDRLDEAPRRRRHLRAARVLEDLAGERLDERAGVIAAHYDRGGEPTRGAGFHAVAARRAARLYADDDALVHLAASLDRTEEAASRYALLSLREQVAARRGDRETQRADLDELGVLAELLDDRGKACEVSLRWTQLERLLGNRAQEAERVAALKRTAAALGDPLWIARARQAEAASLVATSRYDPARAELEAALAAYRKLGDGPGQVESLCLLAEIAIQQGYLDQVEALLEQARAIPAAQAGQQLLIQTMRAASAAAFARQQFDVSLSLSTEMLALAGTIGDEEGKADSHLRLGTANARLFHVRAAQEHYREADRGYRLLGRRQGQGAVLINAGFLANWLGQYAEAFSSFQAAETIFRELEDVRGQSISALNLGMVAFYQGDHANARQAAERGLTLARQMGSQVMEANALANLGAAEREAGDLESAIVHMQAGIELRRKVGQPSELAVDLCDLTVAYLRQSDLAAARRTSAEMLALHDAAPDSMMYPQHILWAAAQTARLAGDDRPARDLFGRAVATLDAKAAAIPDAESRNAFLELPFNRQLRDARSANWPPDPV